MVPGAYKIANEADLQTENVSIIRGHYDFLKQFACLNLVKSPLSL